MKHNQEGFGIVEILVIIVVVAAIAGAGWAVLHKSSPKTNTNSTTSASTASTTSKITASPPKLAEIKGVKVAADSYSLVTVPGTGTSQGTQYYGKVQKINESYIRLTPVYYYNSANTLVLLGNEMQAPEPVMYISIANISSISQLAATDPHVQAIQASVKATPPPAVTDAFPSASVNQYIKTGQYQAAFFDDGKVYFGKLKSVSSDPLFANQAQVFTLQSSGQQVSLSRVDAGQVTVHTSAHLVFWENLRNDGQISKAIAIYLKQNP